MKLYEAVHSQHGRNKLDKAGFGWLKLKLALGGTFLLQPVETSSCIQNEAVSVFTLQQNILLPSTRPAEAPDA